MILCISVSSVVISPFSLIFFLMSLDSGLSILFIFSKNQLLVLLIFATVFFVSFLFTSALIFMNCFLLLTSGGSSFLLFLVALGVKLDYLIFLLFLEVSLYCYEPFPWHHFLLNPTGFGL